MTRKASPWEMLRRRSVAVRQNLDRLVADLESLGAGEDADAIRGAEVVEAETRAWEAGVAALAARARSVLERLQEQRAGLVETFDQRLSRALRDRGLTVHGEGALLVVDGVVHVELDLEAAVVKINGTAVDDLSPSSVATRVGAEIERLRGLITPPGEMLRQLLAAYEREISSRRQEPGTQVRASSLLVQLAFLRQRPAFMHSPSQSNYREYPRELFRADLHTLLADGSDMVDGKRFRYASGSDPAGAIFMLVPALGRVAHLGRLWFEVPQ